MVKFHIITVRRNYCILCVYFDIGRSYSQDNRCCARLVAWQYDSFQHWVWWSSLDEAYQLTQTIGKCLHFKFVIRFSKMLHSWTTNNICNLYRFSRIVCNLRIFTAALPLLAWLVLLPFNIRLEYNCELTSFSGPQCIIEHLQPGDSRILHPVYRSCV